MAIDNPIEAFKKTHPEEEGNLPQDLVILAAELALPIIGPVIHTVRERLGRKAQNERATETLQLLLSELKDLQDVTATKIEMNDLKESLQLLIRHDAEEFNDKKRGRYIKIIGNALRSEIPIDDLASFIQDVEQLGERDFIALKVLNKVMNKSGDWANSNTKLHPNTFIHRRQELAEEMARAFGMKTDLGPITVAGPPSGKRVSQMARGRDIVRMFFILLRRVPSPDWSFLFRGTRLDSWRGGLDHDKINTLGNMFDGSGCRVCRAGCGKRCPWDSNESG